MAKQYVLDPENSAGPEAMFDYQRHVSSALYAVCLTPPGIGGATAHLAESSPNSHEGSAP